MMKALLISMALALAACDNPTPPKTTESAPDPLFATQRQALQKAQAVQAQVDDAAEAQKKQIEQAAQQ